MEKSSFSKRFWGLVFALTILGSVGAVAKALAANEAAPEKNLQTLPATSASNESVKPSSEEGLASDAGKEFKSGAGGIGRGFTKGAQVTGHAFKKAGTTMASGFKKAGSAIRDYFMGKKDNQVEESDLSGNAEAEAGSATTTSRDGTTQELDAVGNEMPKKAEPRSLSKKTSAVNSEVD